MPNHVQNVLTFSSRESLEKVMNALKPGWTEEDGFRFEWIVPFPKTKEECPQEYVCEDPAAAHIQADTERPWLNWYEFQCNEWGTKWNAYEVSFEGNELWFQTAWSPPIPVLEKLVNKLPKGIGIEYKCSEEQGPLYCAEGYITDQSFDLNEFDEYSDEAYQMANDLWGEYWYKEEETGEWFTEDSPGAFLDEGRQWRFYNIEDENPCNKEKALRFHQLYGKPFDDMIVECTESTNIKFLEETFGFVRISEKEYKFNIDNYVNSFDEAEHVQSFSEEALDKVETA